MDNFDPVGGGYLVDQFGGFLAGLLSLLWQVSLVLIPVLIVLIIWLLYKLSEFRVRFHLSGRGSAPEEKRAKKHWENILKRLDTGLEAEYALAIIEADNLVDDFLKRSGFQGGTMMERLSQISPVEFPGLEELKEAHRVRNNLAHTTGYKVTKDQAQGVMRKYQQSLENLEVI